jgi:hypothetical protein
MRFKAFKNFSIGKIKDKNEKGKSASKEEAVAEVTEIEDKANAPAAEAIQDAGTADIILGADDVPIRPHGPAGELSVEPEDLEDNTSALDEEEDDDAVKPGEEAKTTEIIAEKASAPKEAPAAAPLAPTPEKTEAKPDESDSLNNLFSTEEEEENPLASLINSLPDVTVQELMDDLEEIHRIIKEWRPSAR